MGAQDAPHSQLHTAANASYIRVLLKDDLKGLGFDRAKENEVTGLDVFSDVLSRLNGKSEEAIAGEQMARLAVKTHAFVEQKYGPMRFVRGGLLVGDKVLEEAADENSTSSEDNSKEKKRKAPEVDQDEDEPAQETKEKKKRRKDTDAESTKKSRKEKKSSKSKSKSVDNSDDEPESKEARRARKEAKKARKEEKRLKKEKKKAKKADSSSSSSESEDDSATGTSTPATEASTPRLSRNFSRSKYIASKKMAVLDSKALAQVRLTWYP